MTAGVKPLTSVWRMGIIFLAAIKRSWRNRQTRTFEGRMGDRMGSSPIDRTTSEQVTYLLLRFLLKKSECAYRFSSSVQKDISAHLPDCKRSCIGLLSLLTILDIYTTNSAFLSLNEYSNSAGYHDSFEKSAFPLENHPHDLSANILYSG